MSCWRRKRQRTNIQNSYANTNICNESRAYSVKWGFSKYHCTQHRVINSCYLLSLHPIVYIRNFFSFSPFIWLFSVHSVLYFLFDFVLILLGYYILYFDKILTFWRRSYYGTYKAHILCLKNQRRDCETDNFIFSHLAIFLYIQSFLGEFPKISPLNLTQLHHISLISSEPIFENIFFMFYTSIAHLNWTKLVTNARSSFWATEHYKQNDWTNNQKINY